MSKRVYVRKTEPILEGAEKLFLRKGFADTSMQEVATESGVAKATLYSNFPSKEDLFSAVIHRRAEKNQLNLQAIDLDSVDVHETLVDLACAFLRDIYSREQVELFQTVVADARRFPLLGKMMLEGPFEKTHGEITRYFVDRVADGTIRHDDPHLAADYFMAIIKARMHIPLIFSQAVSASPKAIRKIASGAVSIFLDGVGPR